MVLKFFVLFSLFVFARGQDFLSPCPGIFEYQFDGNSWYGLITQSNYPKDRDILLQITMSLSGTLNPNNFGSISLLEGMYEILPTIQRNGQFHYKVTFPISANIPVVTSIRTNGVPICNGAPRSGLSTTIHLNYTIKSRTDLFANNNQLSGTSTNLVDNFQNPCPTILQYVIEDKIYGLITIKEYSRERDINLKVVLSIADAQLPNGIIGSLNLVESKREIIPILRSYGAFHFKIDFPIQTPLPKINSIILNENVICSGPPANGFFVRTITLTNTVYFNPEIIASLPAIQNNPLNANPILNTFTIPDNPFTNPLNSFTGLTGFEDANLFSGVKNPLENPFQQNPIQSPVQKPLQTTTLTPVFNLPTQPSRFNTWDMQPIQDTNVQTKPPTTIQNNTKPNSFLFTDVCGDTKIVSLISKGTKASRGDFPWLSVIYQQSEIGSIKFICGGNLISNKHILTAAHCVLDQPDEYLVSLGKYYSRFEPQSTTKEITKIKLHHDYTPNADTIQDSDVALLYLKETVEFNNFIKPICIKDLGDLSGNLGKIAGWGAEEDGTPVSKVLKQTTVKIVSQETCKKSHKKFEVITDRIICAGSPNDEEEKNSGACRGDSGGGLFVSHGGRMYLEGIISSSIGYSFRDCNTEYYSVFINVNKFTNWIYKNIAN